MELFEFFVKAKDCLSLAASAGNGEAGFWDSQSGTPPDFDSGRLL